MRVEMIIVSANKILEPKTGETLIDLLRNYGVNDLFFDRLADLAFVEAGCQPDMALSEEFKGAEDSGKIGDMKAQSYHDVRQAVVTHIEQKLMLEYLKSVRATAPMITTSEKTIETEKLSSDDLIWILYGGENEFIEGDGAEKAFYDAYLYAYARENPWLSSEIALEAAKAKASAAKAELEAIRRNASDCSEAFV